jgi:aminopeptidase N
MTRLYQNISTMQKRTHSVLALCAFAIGLAQCTPKSGTSTAATPVQPTEPKQWVEPKPTVGEPDTQLVEINVLEPIDITPEQEAQRDTLPPYNPSHTFEVDLIHEKVEISFDWAKRRANGVATLTLKPWFYATDKVTLDAKNFDILAVTLESKGNATLQYNYNNEAITIQLDRVYTRTEEVKIKIKYTAKPDERSSYGGSSAIVQDKGLYFINHDGKDPMKPRQIWTQGETESNSYWMPTVDKPNERCTQEMYITVEDKFKTLSNGVLVSSNKNADGTRTDYWKMDQPHAPYLFMMAIGEYSIVKDKWRNIPVEYYVEPAYEQYARDIFPYTPEMLELFSNQLGYAYPWPKYSQVVVRDYVSGAMENTSAVIFGEFMQKDKRELMDVHLTNEKIVAHEMFHHWFGDLVTTENWANLTLNEGFANYSEYLWMEHKYGREAADYHLEVEQTGFFSSASDGGHPLIHYGYSDKEDMFDAHSYNKGGCILHMLRGIVGDEAFFASLQRYLKRNEFTDVEVHELRLAFEDVTGRDLAWFFDQWFLASGYPILEIEQSWDEATKTQSVAIKQTQEGDDIPHIFRLPMFFDVYEANGQVRRVPVEMTKRTQVWTLKCESRPALVNVDADRRLLALRTDDYTPEQWTMLLRKGPLYADRSTAMANLETDRPASQSAFVSALNDKSSAIRVIAIARLDGAVLKSSKPALDALIKLAQSDPESEVRTAAITRLAGLEDPALAPVFLAAIKPDESFQVVGEAFSGLIVADPGAAEKAALQLEKDKNAIIRAQLAQYYVTKGDITRLAWFQDAAKTIDGEPAISFFKSYSDFLATQPAAVQDAAIKEWIPMGSPTLTISKFRRFSSMIALGNMRNNYNAQGNAAKATELTTIIDTLIKQETDEYLIMLYSSFK